MRRKMKLVTYFREGYFVRAPLPRYIRKTVITVLLIASSAIWRAEAGNGANGGRSVPWWHQSTDWGSSVDGSIPSERRASGSEPKSSTSGNASKGRKPTDRLVAMARQQHIFASALAREFVSTCAEQGLGEEEEFGHGSWPECDIASAENTTLRRLEAGLDSCASPYYTLTEIFPNQLVYTEVDSAMEEARLATERRRLQAAAKRAEQEQRGQESDEEQLDPKDVDKFLGIFLYLEGDYFSIELENALKAIAPAYPRAWIVKANATDFVRLCVKYNLSTFPQLLLFKNDHFVSRYHGRRTTSELAAWLSLFTGDLPRAKPRRASPPPPLPNVLSVPRVDEPIVWCALLYAVTKLLSACAFLLKRRGGVDEGNRGQRQRRRGVSGYIWRTVGRFISESGREGIAR